MQRHVLGRSAGPPWHYLWVALILAVTGLVPTVAVPLLLPADRAGSASNLIEAGSPGGVVAGIPDPVPSAATDVAVATTAPGGAPGTTPPPAGATPQATALAGTQPRAITPSATVAGPRPTRSWRPLVIEAEAGWPTVVLRRAEVVQVAGASGGRAVRFTSRRGEVQLRSLALPADGRYRVTIMYAPADRWSARLRTGDRPTRVSFGSGNGCCASVTVELRLAVGATLRIRSSHRDGAVPAIDQIVIERT